MSYLIVVSEDAQESLRKLQKSMASRVTRRLEQISDDPYAHVKRLTGVDLFSLRVGDYRIIMDIQSKRLLIFVIKIAHRRDVYADL